MIALFALAGCASNGSAAEEYIYEVRIVGHIEGMHERIVMARPSTLDSEDGVSCRCSDNRNPDWDCGGSVSNGELFVNLDAVTQRRRPLLAD